MNIKTARPLPPTPAKSTPAQPSVNSPHPSPTPANTQAASAPTNPLTRPQSRPAAKAPTSAPLATPEENKQIEQQIENSSPTSLQANASAIPMISPLQAQNPQRNNTISKYQQLLAQIPGIDAKQNMLSTQILQKLPLSAQQDFQAQTRLEQKHSQAEFQRQMQFANTLRTPGPAQVAQRQSIAAQNHQARMQEAAEMLNLKLTQAGQDPAKQKEAQQAHTQQLANAKSLLAAETVDGNRTGALLQGIPHMDAQRQTLGAQRNTTIVNHRQQFNALKLNISQQQNKIDAAKQQRTEKKDRIRDLERTLEPQETHVANLEIGIQDLDADIQRLKNKSNMSSLELKGLMIRKDDLQNQLTLARQPLEKTKHEIQTQKDALAQSKPHFKAEIQSLENALNVMELKTQQVQLAIDKENLLMQGDFLLATP